MNQLKNIAHDFDVVKGDVGVTIRKGGKWWDTADETRVELRVCSAGHDGTCNSLCKNAGIGRKIGAWKGRFIDLPPSLIAIEHNKKARDIEKLKLMLETGYGSINDDDVVTAFIYVRETEK